MKKNEVSQKKKHFQKIENSSTFVKHKTVFMEKNLYEKNDD